MVRLGMPLADDYLEFLEGRCRPNTVLAAAYDLKVFFTVVAKPPAEVRPADVLGFITAQRTGRAGDQRLRPVDRDAEPAGVATSTVARGLSIVSGFFAYLHADSAGVDLQARRPSLPDPPPVHSRAGGGPAVFDDRMPSEEHDGCMPDFMWLPANQASAEDVEAVFATGGAHKCRCQALKVPGWIWRDTTQEQRDAALLEQTACGTTTGPTSGLIGYVDGEAAGWVAVEPRENYPRLWSRKQAWMRMDPELEGVWSVTCFVVRKGRRQSGLTYELAAATVEYGEQVGARVLEGYPIEPSPGKSVIWDEASVGLVQVFLEAGYEVVASPTLRRRVVRRRLGNHS